VKSFPNNHMEIFYEGATAFMKIQPNIGILNALVRITIGLTLLSWSSAKFVKKPWCESYLVVMFLSAMKVAEGIVRYCPVTDLIKRGFEIGSDEEKEHTNDTEPLL
jgi:hypothetical protein